MGSPVDLTLGCSTQAASNGCLYPGDYLESLRQAEEYLRSLEDERRKVEGFKRELPLCIQLLDDAIQTSKEKVASGKKELQVSRSSVDCEKEYGNSAVEVEFMPLNMNMPLKRRWGAQSEGTSDGETEGTSDRRGSKRPAWMAEAQLWTQNSVSSDHTKEKETEQLEQEQSSVTSSQQQQLLLTSKERPAGAFLPFLREQPGTPPVTVSRPIPRTGSGAGLSLSFGEPQACSPSGHTLKTADSEVGSIEGLQHTPDANNRHNNSQQIPSVETAMAAACTGAGSSSGGQSQRKARRCWSPELHRRFVSALHQLGGCQIATPKQIRELMKVDGLTNDEVKSHLQKYRLHTRRPSPSPSQPGAPAGAGQQQQQGPAPQLVVLGGIWVPPKYSPSQGPSSFDQQFQCHSGLPQDGAYFACISNGTPGTVQMHHRQPLFEPSQSQCSPQGPLQVTSQLSGATQGPSSSEVYHEESGEEEEGEEEEGEEEEEEAKSDSTSWKTPQRRSSENNKASQNGSELNSNNLNLQVACSAVQSTTGAKKNTTAAAAAASSEEEVNQAQ